MSTAPLVRVDLMGQGLAGDTRHAQTVMRDLGITYREAIPQSMFDCWDFLFCENVPADLPEWVKPLPELPPGYRTPGHGRSTENIARNGPHDAQKSER